MHIALVGHIAGEDVRAFLHADGQPVPAGYSGAPLTGILIGELLRLGHQVTGITTDAALPLAGGPVRLRGPGFTFVVCPARRRAWRPNVSRHAIQLGRAVDLFALERRAVSEAIALAAPDIVHVHWSYEFALAALDQPFPHLITCHDSPGAVLRHTRNAYRAVRYLMAQQVFRRGREFTTVSDYMAQALAPALGHVPQVIPNPVAAAVLALGRARTAPQTRRVAMVCNGWDRLKNPEPALQAFAQWRAAQPLAELHLYGEGFGAGQTAQRWAAAQGISAGMQFHGRLAHSVLITRLAQADVLLHPSLEESFGVVLAEAMGLGLPVVAGQDSGAVPWVLGADSTGHSEAGILVQVRSPKAILAALELVFDTNYGMRSLGGVRRVGSNFSAISVTQRYEERYLQVLSKASVPRLRSHGIAQSI